MSKSKRKTPIFGIAGGSEKQDKRLANRMFRRKAKVKIIAEDYENLPVRLDEVIDAWCMAKDGKTYWANAPDKAMRK
jgi:hypothetical protein